MGSQLQVYSVVRLAAIGQCSYKLHVHVQCTLIWIVHHVEAMGYSLLMHTLINLSEPVVIQPPVDVLLEFINASAVRISWNYPNEDPSHPVHFVVYYSHDGDPYVNAAAQPVRGRSFVFSGMLYGGYYQFQVVAIQGRSTSEPATTDYFINGITGMTE